MTLERIDVDHATLPEALLPAVKEHLRVRHDRDDTLVTQYIAAAIGLIERQCNVSLDPAVYVCTGDELRPRLLVRSAASYVLPLNNVRNAILTDVGTEPPTDFSDEFTVWNADFGGNGASYLMHEAPAVYPGPSWQIELEVGVDDPSKLAPAFFALIARMTAALYENREASSALWAETWRAELQTLWRPCA